MVSGVQFAYKYTSPEVVGAGNVAGAPTPVNAVPSVSVPAKYSPSPSVSIYVVQPAKL